MKYRLLLLAIIIFAGLLRFTALDKIPPALTADEAAISYNAFSLAKTQKDEHGLGPFPLLFRSFGDYKSPGTHYLLTPLVNTFGLNITVVRLFTAIFGVLSTIFVYWLVSQIFANSNLGLITALLVSFSPWHVNASRMIFEPMNGFCLSLLGLACIIAARKHKPWLILGLLAIVGAAYTYTVEMVLIPLLTILTIFIYRRRFFVSRLSKISIGIFLLISLSLIALINWRFYQVKSNVTIFNHPQTIETINQRIHILDEQGFPLWLARLTVNKPIVIGKQFIQNYLESFNPDFLFFGFGKEAVEDIGQLSFGNLLLIFLPLLIFGCLYLANNLAKPESVWLLSYLFISLLVNGISTDGPLLHRLFHFHLALSIIAGLGFIWLWRLAAQKFYFKSILIAVLCIGLFNCYQFITYYYAIYPRHPYPLQLVGVNQIIGQVTSQIDDYKMVYISDDIHQSYVQFAFFNQFDPQDFQALAKRAFWVGSFDQVVAYRKYRFQEIPDYYNRCADYQLMPGEKFALVGKFGDMPRFGAVEIIEYPHINPNAIDPAWEIIIVEGKKLNQDLRTAQIPCRVN